VTTFADFAVTVQWCGCGEQRRIEHGEAGES
jgi:hypothetical protein